MSEINKTNLSEQKKIQLSEIIGMENLFLSRDQSKEKKCKYVTASDDIDKILIVSRARSSEVCFISSASVVGAPVGIASASFTLIFSLMTGITKKLRTITRNKKNSTIKFLCWLKVNWIALKL